MKKPELLYEDEDIIVCVKPDGMPSQSDKSMTQDLESYWKKELSEQAIKAGSPLSEPPFVSAVHRLDRPVGGVMVLAKNKQAAAELSRQIKEHTMVKYYQAVVSGFLPDMEGTYEDTLIWDRKKNISRVVASDTKEAKTALLDYEVLDELETDSGAFSYVLIRLETGRHHQIRCQMAHHGNPIVGDLKYAPAPKKTGGQKKQNIRQLALISTRLEFAHPTTKEWMVYKTEPWGEGFALLDAEDF